MESTFDKLVELYNNDYMPAPSHKCAKCGKINGPKCPTVGENYDNQDGIPKLLIISLDTSVGVKENVRKMNETDYKPSKNEWLVKNKKKSFNPHWRETLDIVKIITTPFLKEKSIKNNAESYFSHTNSAKCKEQIKTTDSSPYYFFDNCKDFVRKDIKEFAPNIIVTQGENATLWLNDIKPKERVEIKSTRNSGKHKGVTIQLTYKVIEFENRKILVIPMAHPTSRLVKWSDGVSRGGLWAAQKQIISDNIREIKEKIEELQQHQ